MDEESSRILQILDLNSSEVTSCDFNENNLLAIGSIDKTVRVLEWKAFGLGFVDKQYSPIFSHKFGVTCVKFSPKGIIMVSSSLDGTANLYAVDTGDIVWTIVQPNKASIRQCEFTSDSKKLITCGDDGVFCFWDLGSRSKIRYHLLRSNEDFLIKSFCISSDSKFLATGDSRGLLKLWSIVNITAVEPECFLWKNNINDGITCCQFSPKKKFSVIEGKLLIYEYFVATCGDDCSIKIWKLVMKKYLNSKPDLKSIESSLTIERFLKGHVNQVLSIRYNSSGNHLGSTGLDNTVKLWEVSTGNCMGTFVKHKRFGTCLAFSKDSNILATGSNDRTVIVWKLNKNITLESDLFSECDIYSHFMNVNSINLSHDEEVGVYEGKHKKKLKLIQTLKFSSNIESVHFNGSSILISGGGDKTVRIWKRLDKSSPYELIEKLEQHKYSVNYVEISPCATKIISCSLNGIIISWDIKTNITYEMRAPNCKNSLRMCRFSPDSKLIAAGGDDQILFLWDANHLELKKSLNFYDTITSVTFTPDSKFVLITCFNGHAFLYDLMNGLCSAEIKNCHDLGTNCSDFSLPTDFNEERVEDDSDNKLKKKYVYLLGTCGHDSLIKIWKVTRSKIAMIRQLSGHGGSVTFIRFSPNLPFVLASCATDSTVRIWNTKSSHILCILSLHGTTVTTCSFSQDSTLIATGSLDKTILVWSASEQLYRNQASKQKDDQVKDLYDYNNLDISDWFLSFGLFNIAKQILKSSLTGADILCRNTETNIKKLNLNNDNERQTASIVLNWLIKDFNGPENMTGKNIPHQFLCPLTHQIMKNPVNCSDGYTYEKRAIEERFTIGQFSSPITKEIFKTTKFQLNLDVKKSVYMLLYKESI